MAAYLVEEVQGLGMAERNAPRSPIARIVEHGLKLDRTATRSFRPLATGTALL